MVASYDIQHRMRAEYVVHSSHTVWRDIHLGIARRIDSAYKDRSRLLEFDEGRDLALHMERRGRVQRSSSSSLIGKKPQTYIVYVADRPYGSLTTQRILLNVLFC